jgi:thiamine biosynthesis lipoprotein
VSQRTVLSRSSNASGRAPPPPDLFRRRRRNRGHRPRGSGGGQGGLRLECVDVARHEYPGRGLSDDDHDHRAGNLFVIFVFFCRRQQVDHDSADHDHHDAQGHLRGYGAMTGTMGRPAEDGVLLRTWPAIGTSATTVVQHPTHGDIAERLLRAEIHAFDLACSRFRSDSELQMVHAQAGQTVRVSAVLFEALEVACAVARRTGGAVDPTIGNALENLGYDRDLKEVNDRPRSVLPDPAPVIGHTHVHLDRRRRTVRIPRGVRLDLGSSAKALIADRAAARIADAVGAGALVSIGGDVAVAGEPPQEGWSVGIATSSATPVDEVDQAVAIRGGGLASSSPSVRAWRVGDRPVHHILDPATGDSVPIHWTLVSAAGASCVEANAMSTAALVWGKEALERLRACDQAVRLVRHDGRTFSLNGWPEERAA